MMTWQTRQERGERRVRLKVKEYWGQNCEFVAFIGSLVMQYVDAFEGTPAERRSSGMDKSPTTIVVWKRQIPASSDSEDTVTCELKFKVSENSFVAIWQPHDPDITEGAFLVDEDEDEFFADPSFAIIRYTKGINDGSFTYRPGGREETTAVKPLQFHSDLKPVNDIICEQSSFACRRSLS